MQAILPPVRARASGRGQFIDVPPVRQRRQFMPYISMGYLAAGWIAAGRNNTGRGPGDVRCARGKLVMMVAGDNVWNKLVRVLGDPPELKRDFETIPGVCATRRD